MSPSRLLTCQFAHTSQRCWLVELTGHEAISSPFRFELVVFTQQPMAEDKVVGQRVDFAVLQASQRKTFNGVVAEIQQQPESFASLFSYKITVVPWFYLLNQHHDCRAYRSQSVLEIAQFWWKKMGIVEVDSSRCQQHYPKLDYCVQFNESVFDFLSRLFAQAGLYYYFRFSHGQHVLVLCDSVSGYLSNPRQLFFGKQQGQHVSQWQEHFNPAPKNLTCIDYDYRSARDNVQFNSMSTSSYRAHAVPYTVYPGGYHHLQQGERLSRLFHECNSVPEQLVTATTNVVDLVVAQVITLIAHDTPAQVIHAIEHQAKDDSQLPVGVSVEDSVYINRIQGMPSKRVFRPQPLGKPCVGGVHTAKVIGPKEETIHCDDKGRIKVHFHWDRHTPVDLASSCWLRVAHQWAGADFGCEFIPHVGQEVLVQYENGDPDYPVVIGAVYNADNRPPYELPRQASRSGFKLPPSAVGHDDGNEFTFDDQAKQERIFIQAQKEYIHTVANDLQVKVQGHHQINVQQDMHTQVSQGYHRSQAAKQVVLQAGNSTIAIHPEGIDIRADNVFFNDSEPAGGASALPAKHWVQARYLDQQDQPIQDMAYVLTHADGTQLRGHTDASGSTGKLSRLYPGTASIELGEKAKLLALLQAQRKQLKAALDQIYGQLQQQVEKQRKQWQKKSNLTRSWNFFVGLLDGVVSALGSTLKGVGHFFWQAAQVQAMDDQARGINMRAAMGESLPGDQAQMQAIQMHMIALGKQEYSAAFLAAKILSDAPSRKTVAHFCLQIWRLWLKKPLDEQAKNAASTATLLAPFVAMLLSGNQAGALAEVGGAAKASEGMFTPVTSVLKKIANTLMELSRCQEVQDAKLDRLHNVKYVDLDRPPELGASHTSQVKSLKGYGTKQALIHPAGEPYNLPPEQAKNFFGKPNAVDLSPGTKLVRFYDHSNESSLPNGRYWLRLQDLPESKADWRSNFAISSWNQDGAYVIHEVGDAGLKGWEGAASSQQIGGAAPGWIQLGGKNQLFLPNSIDDVPVSSLERHLSSEIWSDFNE